MSARGPLIVVVDDDPRGRLRAVSALHERYEVLVPEPGEELLRVVRRVRPAAVLLAMSRGRASASFRLCRALKTDGRDPPAVGLVDRWSRLEDPSASLTSCLGDGYLGGQLPPQEIRRWVGRLVERRGHAVVTGPAELTFRDRLLRRKR